MSQSISFVSFLLLRLNNSLVLSLKRKKNFIFSKFWGLKVQYQGTSRLVWQELPSTELHLPSPSCTRRVLFLLEWSLLLSSRREFNPETQTDQAEVYLMTQREESLESQRPVATSGFHLVEFQDFGKSYEMGWKFGG